MFMLDDHYGKKAYQNRLTQAQFLHQHTAPSRVINARVARYEKIYRQRRHLEAQQFSASATPRVKRQLATWLNMLAEKLSPSNPQPLKPERRQS